MSVAPLGRDGSRAGLQPRIARAGRWGLVIAVLAILALVPYWAPGYRTTLATEMLIFALLAMSIDIMEGFAGRTTLCHGALFGVSAYVLLYHVVESGGALWSGIVLGVLASTAVAATFALLAVR
ncbi:MAG: branched-chain amino acid ABC transporter permease, partial [Variibacter sp.]|nr:branched-chain amino acid ABC transporter permease [Variibacter sp.]